MLSSAMRGQTDRLARPCASSRRGTPSTRPPSPWLPIPTSTRSRAKQPGSTAWLIVWAEADPDYYDIRATDQYFAFDLYGVRMTAAGRGILDSPPSRVAAKLNDAEGPLRPLDVVAGDTAWLVAYQHYSGYDGSTRAVRVFGDGAFNPDPFIISPDENSDSAARSGSGWLVATEGDPSHFAHIGPDASITRQQVPTEWTMWRCNSRSKTASR